MTPKRLLLLLIAATLVAVLLAPAVSDPTGGSLSSNSSAPTGARGFYEILDRLDYPVARWLRPMRTQLDTASVYVILSPPIALTTTEVSRLLATVRNGASLLIGVSAGDAMSDSLGLASHFAIDGTDVALVLRRPIPKSDSLSPLTVTRGTQVFHAVKTKAGVEPVAIGFGFGRGRIVAFADEDLFSNEELRRGNPAVRAVRMIDFLQRGDRRQPLYFDEYHHGFGEHAALVGTSTRALLHTPPGRTALQIGLAALILLVALAVRPIKPQPIARIERRSALEHVDALANAYEAVRADRRAAQLLVRGLRRRITGMRASRDDAVFLQAIKDRKPELSDEVDRVLRHLQTENATETPEELTAVIAKIERELRT